MPFSYFKEITNNYPRAERYLHQKGDIDCACIYCQQIETINSQQIEDFETIPDKEGGTLICPVCMVDAVIPITDKSILFKMNREQQLEQLQKWYAEGFGIPSNTPEKNIATTEKHTCTGCLQGLANQEAHMDFGGCLYFD